MRLPALLCCKALAALYQFDIALSPRIALSPPEDTMRMRGPSMPHEMSRNTSGSRKKEAI